MVEFFVLSSVKQQIIDRVDTCQFGYLPGSSTTSALISLHDFVTECLDKDSVTAVALLAFDFSKAFDTVDHEILIETITELNFTTDFVKFTRNYLSNRFQRVRIKSSKSSLLPVTSGVPQGSLIGPYYFLLYIASLKAVSCTTKCVKYADDCNFLIPIYKNDIYLSIKNMQNEIDNVKSWSLRFGLSLNDAKTKLLFFKKRNFVVSTVSDFFVNIPVVDNLKLLGVVFTSELSWTVHFNCVIKRISQRLYLLRTLRPSISHCALHYVFNSLICSIVEYAAPLFCIPDKHIIVQIERFYKRCFKIMNCKQTNCTLQSTTISVRFELLTLKFLSKVENISNKIHYVLPTKHKYSNHFQIPYHCTNRRQNCFSIRGPLLHNSQL